MYIFQFDISPHHWNFSINDNEKYEVCIYTCYLIFIIAFSSFSLKDFFLSSGELLTYSLISADTLSWQLVVITIFVITIMMIIVVIISALSIMKVIVVIISVSIVMMIIVVSPGWLPRATSGSASRGVSTLLSPSPRGGSSPSVLQSLKHFCLGNWCEVS